MKTKYDMSKVVEAFKPFDIKRGRIIMNNYPAGVKDSDFDDKTKSIELELHIDDLDYDNGYGEQSAELTVTVTVKGSEVTIHEDGRVFLIDQDGGNMSDFPYDEDIYDHIIIKEALRLASKEIIE